MTRSPDQEDSMEDPFNPSMGRPVAPWHAWFAWRPVETVDRGWTWLRFVSRRRIQKHDYLDGGFDEWWQYASREGTTRSQLAHDVLILALPPECPWHTHSLFRRCAYGLTSYDYFRLAPLPGKQP